MRTAHATLSVSGNEFRVAPTRVTALLALLRRGATIEQIQGAAGAGGASRATAQRYLAALRHGFGCAIEYDRRKKLYRLTGRGASQ